MNNGGYDTASIWRHYQTPRLTRKWRSVLSTSIYQHKLVRLHLSHRAIMEAGFAIIFRSINQRCHTANAYWLGNQNHLLAQTVAAYQCRQHPVFNKTRTYWAR